MLTCFCFGPKKGNFFKLMIHFDDEHSRMIAAMAMMRNLPFSVNAGGWLGGGGVICYRLQ